MDKINIDEIRDIIQDCNINFLIGSGMSVPYLELLGEIEILLTALAEKNIKNEQAEKIIEASVYKMYFERVIKRNVDILNNDTNAKEVLNNYEKFLLCINSILLARKSTILSKQVNIFTTNIDVFMEKALENIGLEFNDGFSGRFCPKFSLTNFKKTSFKKSLHFDNTSEIPVFNLLKVHGSLTWGMDEANERICFSSELNQVKVIGKVELSASDILPANRDSKIDDLIKDAEGKTYSNSIDSFLEGYKKLMIVNPTKEKLRHTLFNRTYYDMLRIYSNELEKENTVLFVMGCSFADEHITDLTLRAARSNPTLIIYVIAHTGKSREKYEKILELKNVKNNNIKIIAPSKKKSSDNSTEEDEYEFSFTKINEVLFDELLKKIGAKKAKTKEYDWN